MWDFIHGRSAFLLVSATQRSIPFLLLPLFVSTFTPREYGQVGVLAALFTLGSMTFGWGQEFVAYRFFQTQSAEGSHRVAAIIQVAAPITLLGLSALLIFIGSIRLADLEQHVVFLAFAAAAVYCVAWQYPSARYRYESRTLRYMSGALLFSCAVAAAKLVFVFYLELGVLGWVLGDLAGSTVLLAFTGSTLAQAIGERSLPLHSSQFRAALRMGSLLTVSQVARWAAAFSDRIVVAVVLSPFAAGSYFLAAQLASIGNVVYLELARFLQPQFSRDRSTALHLLKRSMPRNLLFVALTTVTVTAISFAMVVSGTADEYDNVFVLTVGLLLGGICQGLTYTAGDVMTIVLDRSRLLATVSTAIGVVNVMLNLTLVPWIGVAGAVLAFTLTQATGCALLWHATLRYLSDGTPPRV